MTVELLNREEELTKTDRRILDFISGHPEEFLFSSIGQLAERLQVSEATISRFARHAGYRDFKELKQHVMDKNSGKGPAKKMAATLLKEESFRVESWLRYQQECLQKTMEEMDEEAFERAAGAVAGARRVFIHAKNASGAMGELLFFRLRRSGIDVTRIPASGSEMLEGLAQAKEGDLVVFFAFSICRRRAGSFSTISDRRVIRPSALPPDPICQRRTAPISACMCTGERPGSIIPWQRPQQ